MGMAGDGETINVFVPSHQHLPVFLRKGSLAGLGRELAAQSSIAHQAPSLTAEIIHIVCTKQESRFFVFDQFPDTADVTGQNWLPQRHGLQRLERRNRLRKSAPPGHGARGREAGPYPPRQTAAPLRECWASPHRHPPLASGKPGLSVSVR